MHWHHSLLNFARVSVSHRSLHIDSFLLSKCLLLLFTASFIDLVLFQIVTSFDYDLIQAVEILDHIILNWDKVVERLRDSRRIPLHRFHMQEVCVFVSVLHIILATLECNLFVFPFSRWGWTI